VSKTSNLKRAGISAASTIAPTNADVSGLQHRVYRSSATAAEFVVPVKGAPGAMDYHQAVDRPVDSSSRRILGVDHGGVSPWMVAANGSSLVHQPNVQFYHVITAQTLFPYWVFTAHSRTLRPAGNPRPHDNIDGNQPQMQPHTSSPGLSAKNHGGRAAKATTSPPDRRRPMSFSFSRRVGQTRPAQRGQTAKNRPSHLVVSLPYAAGHQWDSASQVPANRGSHALYFRQSRLFRTKPIQAVTGRHHATTHLEPRGPGKTPPKNWDPATARTMSAPARSRGVSNAIVPRPSTIGSSGLVWHG